MKFDNVKIGDKIQFVYTGGSHPNSIRTVTVSEISSNTINGFDEYVNEYRSFLKNKISFLQSIEPKEKLSVSIEKYGDDWEKIFSSADIDVESKVKIKSSGLSKIPDFKK